MAGKIASDWSLVRRVPAAIEETSLLDRLTTLEQRNRSGPRFQKREKMAEIRQACSGDQLSPAIEKAGQLTGPTTTLLSQHLNSHPQKHKKLEREQGGETKNVGEEASTTPGDLGTSSSQAALQ